MRRPLCQPLGKRYSHEFSLTESSVIVPILREGKLRLSQLEQLALMMLRERGRLGFVPQGCLTPHPSLSSHACGAIQVPGWGTEWRREEFAQGEKKLQVPDSRNAQSCELCCGHAFPSL